MEKNIYVSGALTIVGKMVKGIPNLLAEIVYETEDVAIQEIKKIVKEQF